MALFLDILTKVTLPIIVMVAIGWLLQPKLKLDVGTLNRLQVYVVMPAFFVHFLSMESSRSRWSGRCSTLASSSS